MHPEPWGSDDRNGKDNSGQSVVKPTTGSVYRGPGSRAVWELPEAALAVSQPDSVDGSESLGYSVRSRRHQTHSDRLLRV
ncbi:hypothetical protein ElyMa_002395500 [Elysia marginata]|uniref:Uncharacterized protein n=1 Tax=Elysia marginata TaxID=1093978 RepID=A0AAV4GEE6_9GAST|nr:hypothetical protein ElyMa_002395500 [Elysia marginata]